MTRRPARGPARVDPLRTPDDAVTDLRAEWTAATTDAQRAEVAAFGQAAALVADVLRHPVEQRARDRAARRRRTS